MRSILAVAVSLALTGACRNSAPDARPTHPTPPPTPAGALSLTDPLALLPAESDIVTRLDVAALRKSPLFGKYRNVVREFLMPGLAGCSYDPFDHIESVTTGMPLDTRLAVFVVRGLDRDPMMNCLHSSQIETDTSVTFDGEIIELRNKSGHTNLLTFVDAKTAVLQGSTGPTRATLEKALRVGSPLREDNTFAAAAQDLTSSAALVIVSRPGSSRFSEMATNKFGTSARGFATTLEVTEVITAHFTMDLADAATAEAVVERIRPQLGALHQFVERSDIRADQARVIIDVSITEAQIRSLVELFMPMIPH